MDALEVAATGWHRMVQEPAPLRMLEKSLYSLADDTTRTPGAMVESSRLAEGPGIGEGASQPRRRAGGDDATKCADAVSGRRSAAQGLIITIIIIVIIIVIASVPPSHRRVADTVVYLHSTAPERMGQHMPARGFVIVIVKSHPHHARKGTQLADPRCTAAAWLGWLFFSPMARRP